MEISKAITEITSEDVPPTSVVHRGARKGREVEALIRYNRRNGQPARLVLRYVNGAPSEGLPSQDAGD